MKELAKRLLALTPLEGPVRRLLGRAPLTFETSEQYWTLRYRTRGLNSGPGSYGRLAEFKAEVLNRFVEENAVGSVIELGCGDGNQLRLAKYPSYRGFDVSADAVRMCRRAFSGDPTKSFAAMKDLGDNVAELTMSLDVIYHLIEDAVFEAYMTALFGASTRFVCIYSSNKEPDGRTSPHVRHRRFTDWTDVHAPEFRRIAFVANRFPYDPDDPERTSFADFHFFERTDQPLSG